MMWKLREYDKSLETDIRKECANKLLARLLTQRNIRPEDVKAFISNEYESLSDPYEIDGIEKAVHILASVAKDKKRVAVIGDYDCDGIFSSVMIRETCQRLGVSCKVFLPSRLEHGYGLSTKTVEAFREVVGTDIGLLILVDCGTNNHDEIELLKADGVEHVVVIDHHVPDEATLSSNADALINWHLSEGTKEMCATGEVFQFIRGIRKKSSKVDPIEFLTYAAIGTIADISPVLGDNRVIVKHGLGSYAGMHVLASGLSALKRKAYINGNDLTQEDVSFRLAPRINAVGRLESPVIAYGLLVEQDQDQAELISDYVDSSNRQRKSIQRKIEYAVEATIEGGKYSHGILVHNSEWHIGVVGIVAARIAETFHKPVLILGEHNGVIKGSARTYGDINLKEVMDGCSHIFERYGGHAAAAGATLKREFIQDAPAIFDEACRVYCEKYDVVQGHSREYDINIPPAHVTLSTAQLLLDNLYPYCQINNPEPIFKLSGMTISDVELSEGDHWRILRFSASKGDKKVELPFIMYSYQFGAEIDGMTMDIYFSFPQRLQDQRRGVSPMNVIDMIKESK